MTTSKESDIFQPGDLLNHTYRIETILGRGGTSEVFKARSEISGRVIAIKALRAEFAENEDFLVLMTREEEIRDVRHDAIVRYYDTQRMPDGVVYLVMDYIDGPGLDEKLASGGMPANDLLIVGARVCEGLIAAHARNIVHRDLSPDNIILQHDIPAEAVIIDFGIAKDTNPGAETIVGNEFAGKYAYAAPEQLSGRTDQRSDLYSLGALLLSTFRGKKPDIGNNPMEVIERKALPLNVEGVPEPLRSLVAKMSDPDPDKRFATAEELLHAFENPDSLSVLTPSEQGLEQQDDNDATVVNIPTATTPKPIGIPDSKAPPAPETKNTSRGLLWGVLGLMAVSVVAAGGYFSGFFNELLGPRYPIATPYVLVIDKQLSGEGMAVGNVPSPEIKEILTTRMTEIGGQAELTLSSGDISENWGAGLLGVLDQALALEEFRLSVENDRLHLRGLAPDRDSLAKVRAAFDVGFPSGFEGTTDISLGPRFLNSDAVELLLEARADCGRLQLFSPPPIGYGLRDRIIITGRFANASSRESLREDISAIAGDRPIRIEAEILNESLCKIDAILPKVGPGGFFTRFGFGDRAGENPSGRYKVGDNPVIDIALPDNLNDGFLWVSVIDVKGVVYHLLPNLNRPNNSIASLREQAKDGFVRVAYGIQEQETGKLAFTVDGSTLGDSKIVAIYSENPLFSDLRPTTESVASYGEALEQARDTQGFQARSLDTAILTTEE